jgi:hypothetical protein
MLLCTSHPTDGGTGRIFTNDGVFRVSSQTVSLQHSLTHPLIGIFPGFRVAVYCPNDNFHVHRESEEVEDVDDERRQNPVVSNRPLHRAMQQRCHHASSSARSPSWLHIPRPRLQRAATAR